MNVSLDDFVRLENINITSNYRKSLIEPFLIIPNVIGIHFVMNIFTSVHVEASI